MEKTQAAENMQAEATQAREKELLKARLRQRKYRKEHLKDGDDSRLQVILSPKAKSAMDLMAKHHDTTRKEILERVLLAAEKELLENLTDQQAERYRNGEPREPEEGLFSS